MSADASIDPWGTDILGWLLDPITPDDFLRDIWEQKRHLLSRARPGHYGGFFTRDDLEMVITSTGVPSRSEMLIARHDRPRQLIPKTREGLGDLGAVLRAYADGYTFVTAHLEELSPVIGRLCRALEARLQLHVIANVYLTPADTQSFGLHWDNHDVFILQLEGAKRWRMWGPTYEKPLRDSPVRLTREQLGEPDIVEVRAGDLFYVPRGHPHEPFTAGVSSLHVTLGLFPETWYSLLQTAVRVTTERDVRFRGALPVGYLNSASVRAEMAAKFRELAALFASDASFEASVTRLSTNAIGALAPPAGGHFTSLDRLSSIALDTIVTKPSSAL